MSMESLLISGRDAARIFQGVCSNDYDSVRAIMFSLDDKEMVSAFARVQVELSDRRKTPGLDRLAKDYLSEIGETLGYIFRDVRLIKDKLPEILGMPDNYQRYQSLSVLFGKDPMSFHEWEEQKDSIGIPFVR